MTPGKAGAASLSSGSMLLCAVFGIGGAGAQSREGAPMESCLDARAVERVRSLDVNTLLIAAGDRRFVVAHATGCDAGTEERPSSLVAREGWVCGQEREFVRSGETLCPVLSVTRVDARTYAGLAASADGVTRDDQGRIVLAPLEVVGASARKRGFRGDPDYCFPVTAVRAWSLEGRDLVLQTSRRRTGGHASYRVELATSCPELEWADGIDFRSTTSTGWICGHAGDRVITLEEQVNLGASPIDASTETQDGSALRAGIGSSCPIAAVHPEAR